MLAHSDPTLWPALGAGLVTVIFLDFLVMFFIDRVVAVPGLLLIFQIFGGVLLFLQIAFAVQIIMRGVTGGNSVLGTAPGS